VKNKYRIKFEDAAQLDLADSFDWYTEISPLIAENFLEEVENTLKYLVDNPLIFQSVYKDFRQVPVYKYPYLLVYKIHGQLIKIYRVFPTKTDPNSKYKY
jgi:plasmid stabilization system protein ParE